MSHWRIKLSCEMSTQLVVRIGTRRNDQEVAATLTEALKDGPDNLWGLLGDCGQFAEPSPPPYPPMMGVRIGETFENFGVMSRVLRTQSLVSVLRERIAQGPGRFVMVEVHPTRLRVALPDVPRA